MRQALLSPSVGSRLWLYTVGLLAVLGVTGLALFGPSQSLTSASEPVAEEVRGRAASPSTSISDPVGLLPAVGEGTRSTLSSTHTVFLPLAFRGYWQVPESSFGVQMFGSALERGAVSEASAAGARYARIHLSWAAIEPQNTVPGNYEWPAGYDEWLARLSAHDIKLILTVSGNPSWASAHPGGPITEPAILSELVEFMEAAVAHYSVPPYEVKHWEFYNEPDNGSEFYADYGWGYWGNEPAAYAAMLKAVYAPIKAVDPEAQIVFGGLAYDWFTTEGGPFVQGFLDGVLENGGGAYFDVMNFHYYLPFRSNWDPYGPGMIGKAAYLRNKLAEYDVQKPFICTEAGFWTQGASDNNYELQSRAVPQVFAQGMAADLEIVIWYAFMDESALAGFWGLLTSDVSPKPTFYAYQTMAEQLANAAYVRQLSIAETGSEEVEAYQFLVPEEATLIIVAWTNDELVHGMTLGGHQVIVVDKFGAETLIHDADDGSLDGRVQLSIGPSPVYLRLAQ